MPWSRVKGRPPSPGDVEPEAESTSTEDAIGDEDIEVTNEVRAGKENISASISDSARFRATRDMAQMPAHEHLESTNTWKAEEPICYDIPTHTNTLG